MKEKKPATKWVAKTAEGEPKKLSNTRREDWVDELTFREMFGLSETSVRNYRRQGILRSTKWGGRQWYNVPDVLRTWEENYR